MFRSFLEPTRGAASIPNAIRFKKMPPTVQRLIKQMQDLRPLASAGGLMEQRASFMTYALKLDVLHKLGVLSDERTVLYPLMGADLLPAKYSRLVGMDNETGVNIGGEKALSDFRYEIKHELGIDLPDMDVRAGSVNVRADILAGPESIEPKIKGAGVDRVDVLFIKGWGSFLTDPAWDFLAKKQLPDMDELESRGMDFIRFISEKFLAADGYVVIFLANRADADNLAREICDRFGFEDFLAKKLTPKQLAMLEESHAATEIRIGVDENYTRKYMLGGTMRVLRKIR